MSLADALGELAGAVGERVEGAGEAFISKTVEKIAGKEKPSNKKKTTVAANPAASEPVAPARPAWLWPAVAAGVVLLLGFLFFLMRK